MLVKDVMRHDVTGIEAGASLVQAAIQMDRGGVGWLPVVTDGKVIGVLSERDIITGAVARNRDLVRTTVREVMASLPACCHEKDNIAEAAAIMMRGKLSNLLVLDSNDWLAGSVSLRDLAVKTDDNDMVCGVLQHTSGSP